MTADNKTSGSICHPPYCSCPSPSLNCMAFVVVLPPPPPRVQCHLLPPPSARPPKSDYSPSLRPTVEAGCLEAGECPSMPSPRDVYIMSPNSLKGVHSVTLHSPSSFSVPSLSPPPPLACNSYCVNSSLRCRFPSSPSFSSSSPCEVLPARATRDTRVIMAVPVLDQMGELFDIISNRFPLPPCVPFMLEAVQKTNIQQVCSVFSFKLNSVWEIISN